MRSAAELDRALRSVEPAAVGAFFPGASEAERRVHAPAVVAWWALLDLNLRAAYSAKARQQLEGKEQIAAAHEFRATAQAAMLACAGLAQVKSIGLVWLPIDTAVGILQDRRPDWLDAYAESLCEIQLSRSSAHAWRLARALVRAGLCRPPAHDNYALAALEGIFPLPDWRENQARAARNEPPLPGPALADLLVGERDWFETAFWRLFELDGNAEISLANCDKFRGARGDWCGGLVEAARRGVVSRARLLEASLDALSRDFIQYRAGWFSRFHEALQPTAAERLACADRYLGLLASSIPPTVAFALEAVNQVDAAHPLPAEKLLPALVPVLSSAGQAAVLTALQLLERVADREAGKRGEACRTAVAALLHEKSAVQKRVFDLLERQADPADAVLRARLAEVATAVAASLRPRLRPWLEAEQGRATPVAAITPPPPARPRAVSRIDPSRAITPVTDLDDLLDLAGRTLEAPENPDDIERLLDGISRLCDRRPDDFARRSAPLRKRALWWRDRAFATASADVVVRPALAQLVHAWLGDDKPVDSPASMSAADDEWAFLYRRLATLGSQAAARRALPLLSAPTHLGGWIEAGVLVERWLLFQKQGVIPDPGEQVLALLRLAPENRRAALGAAGVIAGEAGRAVRYALGESTTPGSDLVWLAAGRSLQPFGRLPGIASGADPRSAVSRPGEGAGHSSAGAPNWLRELCSANTERSVSGRGDAFDFATDFRMSGRFSILSCLPLLRWSALIWPANLDRMFARSLPDLKSALGWSDVQDRETAGYLELLALPHTELRLTACMALAFGLAVKDAALRGHAQEGLIAAVSDGRLDSEALGAVMARVLDSGSTCVARWAVSFGEVARVSPAHLRAVDELLIRMLHGDSAKAPRNVAGLLELLLEVRSEIGGRLNDPQARAYLEGLPAGGKGAKLAKQILALGSA